MSIERSWNKDARYALNFNKFAVWPLGLWPVKCDDLFSWLRVVFSTTSQMLAILQKCGDASEVVDYVNFSVCSVLALSKIFAFRLHMDKIFKVFSCALEDWLNVKDDRDREILEPFAKIGRKIFYFQIISCYVSNTLIIIGALPFLVPSIDNGTSWDNKTTMPIKQLPLKTGCMFVESSNEIYGIIYVYESIAIMITAHGNVGCDILLVSLAMHLCGQLELLKANLSEIGCDSEKIVDSRLQIVESIKRHDRLLNLIQALNRTVSGMLVVQLLLNAGMNLMLVIRIILAIKSRDPFSALTPIVAFNVLMLQLYLLSYASDRLSQQAESVLDALYDSNWYELPARLRKNLYFVAMRANRPTYLTAGQFYVMNIENFKNALKASFSYFSILRVMFDN